MITSLNFLTTRSDDSSSIAPSCSLVISLVQSCYTQRAVCKICPMVYPQDQTTIHHTTDVQMITE